MRKAFYFEAKSDQEVDIHIYGAIGWDESSWGSGTNNTAYALVSLIKRLDKVYSKMNIHINSPGGIIDDGLAIYNTIKQAKADTHTYNSGLTASMASIIMLSGKTTHFPKTSIYHLHRASTVAIGNVNDFEQEIENLKTYEATLIQAIADKTGMDKAEIESKWFDGKEHYMTAEQANEYGFVDVMEENAVKTPAALNELEGMKFNQVVELYKKEESGPVTRIIEKIKSKISQNFTNKNSENMKQLVFRAKLTVLLALIGLQEFVLNADGKVEMDLDSAYKINDDLEAKAGEIENLKQENMNLRTNAEALQAKITELQATLDGTPIDGVVNIKTKDVQPVNEAKIGDIDAETSNKLKAYNEKKNGY